VEAATTSASEDNSFCHLIPLVEAPVIEARTYHAPVVLDAVDYFTNCCR
jgi:hypothetical protein